jgi:tripartite-type tricarboxylate transporter receptor subunit TctC
MLRALTLAIASLLAAEVSALPAEKFPQRPIRIIVPFAAGGGVDTLARMLAEKLNARLKATVVVENKGGANGTLGGSTVLQSPPDGYTLLFSSNTHVMAKQVMARAPYDPLTDFTPIARVAQAPLLIVISPRLQQDTLGEVADAAKANPSHWTAATAALGSPGHIAEIAFNQLTTANITITPYRGTAPALTDVAGGHVQMLADAMVVLLPMAKGGNVKAVAITSSHRSPLAADIPTAAESGVPGLEVYSWYGLWGPKALPAELIRTLHDAANDAAKDLETEGQLKTLGIELVNETPAEFASFAEAEVKRNRDLFNSIGFTPE